jgi:hypothetical protein
MGKKRPPAMTFVEWTGATPPAVIGWLFAAMVESGQWVDLHLHVHQGRLPRIVAVRHRRPGRGRAA